MVTPTLGQENLADLRTCTAELQRAYDARRLQLADQIRRDVTLTDWPGRWPSVFELTDSTGRPILAPLLVELVRARLILAMIELDPALAEKFGG